mmetsp:Transcript_11343/g.20438  ORF Transcript_11343/g.20438 Transcript_11343/m.20438 type:complete len:291 (+) Transcript_11343:1237-2109(+)
MVDQEAQQLPLEVYLAGDPLAIHLCPLIMHALGLHQLPARMRLRGHEFCNLLRRVLLEPLLPQEALMPLGGFHQPGAGRPLVDNRLPCLPLRGQAKLLTAPALQQPHILCHQSLCQLCPTVVFSPHELLLTPPEVLRPRRSRPGKALHGAGGDQLQPSPGCRPETHISLSSLHLNSAMPLCNLELGPPPSEPELPLLLVRILLDRLFDVEHGPGGKLPYHPPLLDFLAPSVQAVLVFSGQPALSGLRLGDCNALHPLILHQKYGVLQEQHADVGPVLAPAALDPNGTEML